MTEGKYHPARYHDAGPGEWCVRGPNDFCLLNISKTMAYEISYYLNGDFDRAKKIWQSRQRLEGTTPPDPEAAKRAEKYKDLMQAIVKAYHQNRKKEELEEKIKQAKEVLHSLEQEYIEKGFK